MDDTLTIMAAPILAGIFVFFRHMGKLKQSLSRMENPKARRRVKQVAASMWIAAVALVPLGWLLASNVVSYEIQTKLPLLFIPLFTIIIVCGIWLLVLSVRHEKTDIPEI